MFVRERDLITRQHAAEVTEWWARWSEAIPRALAALNEVKWRAINMDPERAYQIVTEWRIAFPEPLAPTQNEKPGQHLLQPGRIASREIDIQRINDSMREMESMAVRLRMLTEVHVPDDLRTAIWYSKATNKGLNSSMLRDAQVNGRLPNAAKPRSRWLFPISEVIREFPEYRSQIRAAETTDEP